MEQFNQEINHLLMNEHEAEMFRAETKNDEVLQAAIWMASGQERATADGGGIL